MDRGIDLNLEPTFEYNHGRDELDLNDGQIPGQFEEGIYQDQLGSKAALLENDEARSKMLFGTREECYEVYKSYAHEEGFSVRIEGRKPGKIKNALGELEAMDNFYLYYACSKEGFSLKSRLNLEKSKVPPDGHVEATPIPLRKRRETRVGCKAKITYHWEPELSAYYIHEFIGNHNHRLHPKHQKHNLRSNRKVSAVLGRVAEQNEEAGIKLKSSYELLVSSAGGYEYVGFSKSDQKNHLAKRRERLMAYGEATFLLEHFRAEQRKNPGFYYEVEVDNGEQIASIFWADSIMRADYRAFGDSICFDTTFRTNREYRPLGLFVGLNHHRQVCVLGACLMYDETISSFKWVFDTFLRCMNGKEPETLFTDQDAAVASAIKSAFPSTSHALCTWHLGENAKSKLGPVTHTPEFQHHIHFLFHDVDDEEMFDVAWNAFVEECFPDIDLAEDRNHWLSRFLSKREKWCSAWVKRRFTAGMSTTQACESCNATVKTFLLTNIHLPGFFQHFSNMLDSRRREEATKDFEAMDGRRYLEVPYSPIMKKAAEILTPNIFARVQEEFQISLGYEVKLRPEKNQGALIAYTVFYRDREGGELLDEQEGEEEGERLDEHLVLVDFPTTELECSCRLLSSTGYVCRHILTLMQFLGSVGKSNMRTLPDRYLPARWRKDAKGDPGANKEQPPGFEAPGLLSENDETAFRYRKLVAILKLLVLKVSQIEDPDLYAMWEVNITKYAGEVLKKLNLPRSQSTRVVEEAVTSQGGSSRTATLTLKRKPRANQGNQRGARQKSYHEKAAQKTKAAYQRKAKSINKNRQPSTISLAAGIPPFLSQDSQEGFFMCSQDSGHGFQPSQLQWP